mmetsp:Transcript_111520/g.309966  ORF Transcript_111520/g.309966 Transcript_111520/m.309966 type:complete len:118 (-) Transcript_111520:28-381(-)
MRKGADDLGLLDAGLDAAARGHGVVCRIVVAALQEQRVSVPVEGRASNAEVGDHPEPCSGAPETSQEELFAAALVRRLEEVDPCAVPARPLLLACARAPMTSACSTRASTPRRAAMA